MGPRRIVVGTGLLLLFGAVLGLHGCGALTSRDSRDPFATPAANRITVHVDNTTMIDVTVELVGGGRRIDLGFIGSRTQQQFSPTWSRSENIQFVIDQVGGRRATVSGGMTAPGDRVDLVVQEPIARSFVRR